ncbi:MAG TPA: Lacal_2735 family protein [Tangfeifania sp.]|nr:Lacal_2735 family protein [Tangfeifania sp.]
MLGLFKKKTEAEKLNKKYDKLMQEGYELSTINRKASDAKYAEADQVMKQIENLPQAQSK